ncbi:MAG: TonB family protein [Acidobacteriota bacterium]|nr:TonB family protein [Acidobacteriota bacterium]
MRRRLAFIIAALISLPPWSAMVAALMPTFAVAVSTSEKSLRVAVLDFGEAAQGQRVADLFAASLVKAQAATTNVGMKVALLDRGMSRAAARGGGYKGSLNLTLGEARDLGAAIGCDFIIIGDAQTIRRSSLARPIYYEAYASLFVVSARTGRLVAWERPAFEASPPEAAEAALFAELRLVAARQLTRITGEFQAETTLPRAAAIAGDAGAPEVVDLSTAELDDMKHSDVRPPLPYRRLPPPYPDTAARAEAEATVDVTVDIGVDGEVMRVEVIRWAGFGLDDAVIETVRQLHFRSATRAGAPVPVRVLLRYNFRRPPKSN